MLAVRVKVTLWLLSIQSALAVCKIRLKRPKEIKKATKHGAHPNISNTHGRASAYFHDLLTAWLLMRWSSRDEWSLCSISPHFINTFHFAVPWQTCTISSRCLQTFLHVVGSFLGIRCPVVLPRLCMHTYIYIPDLIHAL